MVAVARNDQKMPLEGGGGGSHVEMTEKHQLQLTFERKGGGRGGSHVKMTEKSHLHLVFGCEGGGGGGSHVKATEKSHLSHIWMRGRW